MILPTIDPFLLKLYGIAIVADQYVPKRYKRVIKYYPRKRKWRERLRWRPWITTIYVWGYEEEFDGYHAYFLNVFNRYYIRVHPSEIAKYRDAYKEFMRT